MIRTLLTRYRFMREHSWTHEHLSEYVDSELGAADAERVEEHVSICPQCHQVLETLRRTLDGLRSLATADSMGDSRTADAVIERMRRET